MAATLLERAWTWLHATFPERQLYLRSDGRVQFFTLSPTLQATCAGLTLIFLGWVAFASVNVIFKDRIIAAKDHRYEQMQSVYENRLADLQVSYDEINGALVSAEDTFRSTADQLEAKQRTLSVLLGRKAAVDRALAALKPSKPLPDGTISAADRTASDGDLGVSAAPAQGPVSAPQGNADDSALLALPQPPPPQPRVAKPTKAAMLDGSIIARAAGYLAQLVAGLFPHHLQPVPHMAMKLPAFRALAAETARLQHLSGKETALLVAADHQVTQHISRLDRILHSVGLQPSAVEAKAAARGIGGPEVPLSAIHIDGISDAKFTQAFVSASAHVKELDELFAAFRHIPLTTPVHGGSYDVSSDFGPRIDPFTHHIGFHPGIDFAGPWGSLIHATAPGVVVFAGRKGGYGNCVEIDHGFGIHTRYGHMSAILVHVGEHVQKGAPIGKLGSTGRSTGPHVHYEVWLGDVVRDPSKFIEAGRHVLE